MTIRPGIVIGVRVPDCQCLAVRGECGSRINISTQLRVHTAERRPFLRLRLAIHEQCGLSKDLTQACGIANTVKAAGFGDQGSKSFSVWQLGDSSDVGRLRTS